MLLRFRPLAMALPLSLLFAASCGDDGGDDGANTPDADTTPTIDAAEGGVCAEFDAPATVLDTYPANFSGDVLGAGADLDVASGICPDERSHFPQEGEDQVIRLDNLVAGSNYVVQLDGASDLAFYLATDCSGSTLAAGQCLVFADEATSGPEAADFTAPDSGTVYVVVDHFGAEPLPDGSYTLSVFEPDCTADVDCSGTPDTPFCSNFTCVACVNSFQCDTTEAPACDGTTNTCVAGFDTCTGDDPSPTESADDGPLGATALTPTEGDPVVVEASICSAPADEIDFYAITVAEGEGRVFSLDWTGAADAPDLDLYLFDEDGAILDASFFNKPEVISAPALSAGTYYVAVNKFEADGTPIAAAVDYTLTAAIPECETSFDCPTAGEPVCGPALLCQAGPAECTADDDSEPNDGPASATEITSGVAITAAICNTPSTESDFYAISLDDVNDLTINVTYTDNAAADLDVQVFDANGETLGLTFWQNPEVVTLSYLPAGTYYIQVTYFGTAVTAAHPYTLVATATDNGECTTSADCAAEFSTQFFRGNCTAGACESIDGDALALGAACDSNDDCGSNRCSYISFQESAHTSVCTVSCSVTSECTTAHGAGFSCTVPFDNNFCHPDCTSNLECGTNPNSSNLDTEQPWDYLTCSAAGACELDP